MPRKHPESFDDGLDGRRAAILKHFRCGARRPWCRHVWKSAIDACGGTQDSAAQRLFVNTSAVSEGLQHGRLSIETLVMMMAELQPCGWRLPDLPPRNVVMAEGYIEAMAFLRHPRQRLWDRPRLALEDFAALVAAQTATEWPSAEAEHNRARQTRDSARQAKIEAKRAALAERISRAASRRIGIAVRRSAEELRELHETWGAALTECRDALPFGFD